MGIAYCAKETAELYLKKKKKKPGTVTRNARLGRKAQNRGVLPAPLAKATTAGHGNKLVISERL